MQSTFNSVGGVTAGFGQLVGKIGLATSAVGPLVNAVGGLGLAMGQMAGGAGALLPGIALAGAAVIKTLSVAMSNFKTSTVSQVVDLRNQITSSLSGVRDAIQRSMFDGLAASLKSISSTFIPQVRAGMIGIAGQMNLMAKTGLSFLGTPQTVADTHTGLANTVAAMSNLGKAVQPVLQAFRDLAVTGSNFLPQLTAGIGGVAQKFADFIAHARESGQLQAFIQGALTLFKQLFTVIQNVGGILAGVFNASNASGAGFMNTLVTITGALKALVNNPVVAQGLNAFFTASAAAMGSLITALSGTLPQVLGALAPVFSTLATVVSGVLGDAIRALGPVIVALAPVLENLGNLLGGVLSHAIAILGPLLVSLAPVVNTVGSLLAGLLNQALTALGPILTALVPLIAPLAHVFADVLGQAIQILAQVLTALVPLIQPVGTLLIDVFGVVGPLFASLGPIFQSLIPPLIELVQAILPPFKALWDALTPVIGTIVAAVLPPLVVIIGELAHGIVLLSPFLMTLANQILPGLATAWGGWMAQLLTVVSVVLPPLLSVLGFVGDMLTQFPPLIYVLIGAFTVWRVAVLAQTAMTALMTAALGGSTIATYAYSIAVYAAQVATLVFRAALALLTGPIGIIIGVIGLLVLAFITLWNKSEGFRNFFIGIWDHIKAAVAVAVDWVVRKWAEMGAFLDKLWTDVSGAIVTAWNAIGSFFHTILDAIGAYFTFVWNLISTVAHVYWDIFQFIVINPLIAIYGWVTGAFAAIGGFFTGLWSGISTAAHAVWDVFQNIIINPLQAAWDWVTGVFGQISGWFSGLWSGIVSNAQSLWGTITGAVTGPLQAAWDWITSQFGQIAGWFSNLWSGIVTDVGNILGGVGAVVGNAFSGVAAAAKGALNGIINGINNVVIGGINFVIDGANSISPFTIPHIPNIPNLAAGGIIQPTPFGTIARIAEAGRPERVEPLDENGLSVRDKALIDRLAPQGGGGPTVVHVYIGEQELAQLVDVRVEQNNANLARALNSGRRVLAS